MTYAIDLVRASQALDEEAPEVIQHRALESFRAEQYGQAAAQFLIAAIGHSRRSEDTPLRLAVRHIENAALCVRNLSVAADRFADKLDQSAAALRRLS